MIEKYPSHLLLLVCEVIAGHHHKVIPPGQTSGNCHVLFLQRKTSSSLFNKLNKQTSAKIAKQTYEVNPISQNRHT